MAGREGRMRCRTVVVEGLAKSSRAGAPIDGDGPQSLRALNAAEAEPTSRLEPGQNVVEGT